MSFKLKIILYISTVILIFFMGMVTAHFKIFPYKQFVDLRTSPLLDPLKNMVRQTAGSPDIEAAIVKNSAPLADFVKKVAVNDMSFRLCIHSK